MESNNLLLVRSPLVCLCVFVCASACAHIRECVHVCVHMYHLYMCACVSMYVCVDVHVCGCVSFIMFELTL